MLLFALLFTGCEKKEERNDRLKISFTHFPASIDPRKGGDFASSSLVSFLYEGLTRSGPHQEVMPAIAESWEIEGLILRFFLRRSEWSDGRAVTAYDFADSWKMMLRPEFASLSPHLLFPIRGAEEAYRGTAPLDQVAIRPLSSRLLEVELKEPCPYFLSLTSFPSLMPFRENAVNGPFLIEMISPLKGILLKKNRSYWNRERVHIPRIEIALIADENTAFACFQRGELDWIGGPLCPLPLDAYCSLKGKLLSFPLPGSTFLSFKPHALDWHTRQALYLSIDREKLSLTGEIPATSLLPSLFSESAPLPSYNPEEARAHLALAKIPSDLSLAYKAGALDRKVAEAIQEMWKEELGLKINIQEFEPKVFKEKIHTHQFPLALGFWIAQFDHPLAFLDRFTDPSLPKNFPQYDSSDYRSLLIGGRYREAEELLVRDLPIAPLFHSSNQGLASPRLQGITASSGGAILFEWCFLQEPSIPRTP